jgi:hypothetical protein
MNKQDETRPERDADERDEEVGHEDDIRHALDELGGDHAVDPRTEDPGALPLTEDPFERRTKRTTL